MTLRRFHRPTTLAPRRSFLGPPSPFAGRSSWRRFREDTVPQLRQSFATFWAGPFRTPVVLLLLLVIGIAIAVSLRRLEPVEGHLMAPGGAGVEGAQVEAVWYVRRLEVFENLGRPLARTFGNSMDVAVAEDVVRTRSANTGADGHFLIPGGLTLTWPGVKGPFVRVRFKAKDPLSGRPYTVRALHLPDGTELAGAVDTGTAVGVRDLRGVLDRLELPAPGRIRDIAVDEGRVATAEGTAGVRLYRCVPGHALELVAHRPPEGSEEVHSVGFAAGKVVAFRTRGFDLLEAGADLAVRGSVEGPYERLLAGTEDRLVVLGKDGAELFRTGTLLERTERVIFADPARATPTFGPELARMSGSLLLFAHSDGTVRLVDVDSAYRSAATLTEPGGSTVGFCYVREASAVVLASSSGVSLYDVKDVASPRRVARFELDLGALAVVDRVVLGARGLVGVVADLPHAALGTVVPLELELVDAASAWRVGDTVVVPRLEQVAIRTRTVGIRWDPVLGKTVEETLRLRDTARLAGLRVVSLDTGAVREVRDADRPLVLFREDGLNQSVIRGVTPDGTVYFATPEGRLLARHP